VPIEPLGGFVRLHPFYSPVPTVCAVIEFISGMSGIMARRWRSPTPALRRCGENMVKRAFIALMLIMVAAAVSRPAFAQDYGAIVAAPDRSDADRTTDKRRDPLKLLNFIGVKEGMKVLDMEAGAGYTTELLARAVGPNGLVYAQDSAEVIERQVKDKFDLRAQKPAMKGVIHVIRNYDDPLPPDVRNLDLITFFFAYHDMTYMHVDRAEMNRKLFAALKPGGYLLIADHSAKAGDGTSVGKTFHRIEESVLRKEVEAAGFKLVAEGNFLRHPEDTRDVIVFRAPTPIDEFVLKYQKPQ
jgi:predicted methyltransferase